MIRRVLPPLLTDVLPNEPPPPLSISALCEPANSYFALLPRELCDMVTEMHACSGFIAELETPHCNIYELFWGSENSASDWAFGLFRLAAERYSRFRNSDLFAYSGGHPKHFLLCESLVGIVEQFSRLVTFVYLSVLLRPGERERHEALEKWLDIIELVQDRHKDYLTGGAVASAMLTNPLIQWLGIVLRLYC